MTAWVIVVVVLSGALGLLVHRRLAKPERTDSQDSAEGIPVTDLIAPVRILVALVLAFVLFQTFSSYEDASDAANDEAGAVSTEAEAAALLPSPTGPELVALLRCYARAVAGPGWESLEATRQTSSISNDADERVAAAVAQAQQAGISETLMAEVVAAERDRVAARRVRLTEATPSVPGNRHGTPDRLRRHHRRVHSRIRRPPYPPEPALDASGHDRAHIHGIAARDP
ncbi:MAG: hypothetical protein ACRDQ2_07955 [Gaiellales bacterium]